MTKILLFLSKYWSLIVGLLVIGFFAGRCDNKVIVKTEYVKGPTKTDTVYSERLVPYEVEVPGTPVLPQKPDTIRLPGKIQYVATIVDTAAIIADYVLLNKYSRLLFDTETEGKLIVNSEVQYNKLQKLSYNFTPIYKKVTVQRIPLFTPFILASYNSFSYFGYGGGIYYHNLGFSFKRLNNFNNSTGNEFGIAIKF